MKLVEILCHCSTCFSVRYCSLWWWRRLSYNQLCNWNPTLTLKCECKRQCVVFVLSVCNVDSSWPPAGGERTYVQQLYYLPNKTWLYAKTGVFFCSVSLSMWWMNVCLVRTIPAKSRTYWSRNTMVNITKQRPWLLGYNDM